MKMKPTNKITIHVKESLELDTDIVLSVTGDGSLDWYVDAFKALLYAAGFQHETVSSVFVSEE